MDIPSLNQWDALAESEQLALAGEVAAALPEGFQLAGVRPFALGAVRRRVALFAAADGAVFALVPGGKASIGFSAANWTPQSEEQESWECTADEYELDRSVVKRVSASTTSPRQVEIGPLLVETVPRELGWTPASLDDPDIKELLKDARKGGYAEATMDNGGRILRVTRGDKGDWTAKVCEQQPTHKSLSAAIDRQGFRFPQSDEWEYLCGAGATTLFRWGDHAPCDCYPTDGSPEEAAWRREWVLSGGKLPYPDDGFEASFDLHLRPNGFGLTIALNPYHFELVAEHNRTRGGDGGSMLCGGAGFFAGWLTLATAYYEEHACEVDPRNGLSVGYLIGRRVVEV